MCRDGLGPVQALQQVGLGWVRTLIFGLGLREETRLIVLGWGWVWVGFKTISRLGQHCSSIFFFQIRLFGKYSRNAIKLLKLIEIRRKIRKI
jgi:hypothetical protein